MLLKFDEVQSDFLTHELAFSAEVELKKLTPAEKD